MTRHAPAPLPLSEQIYRTLRERVCLLDYPPGTVLREADLAAEFGVSRTPLRAVLQRLAEGGLIESRDGVGTIVTEPDLDELRDIYAMRMKVAGLIGELSPRMPSADHVGLIDGLIARAAKLAVAFDLKQYWTINHELHFLISGLIGNSALRETWDQLYFRAARMWYAIAEQDGPGVATSLADELREMRRALADGDMTAAGFIQHNYIAAGARRVEAFYAADQQALAMTR